MELKKLIKLDEDINGWTKELAEFMDGFMTMKISIKELNNMIKDPSKETFQLASQMELYAIKASSRAKYIADKFKFDCKMYALEQLQNPEFKELHKNVASKMNLAIDMQLADVKKKFDEDLSESIDTIYYFNNVVHLTRSTIRTLITVEG